VATSQNGWPASSDKRAIGVDGAWSIRGAQFPGGVVAGPVATVLGYVADQFHQRVEPLVAGWCWGWAWRDIRGSTGLSNHASGTAIDVNAPRHPLGSVGTFTTGQAASIRAILAEVGGTVRWGGDYSGRRDEMHFEIVASAATVALVAGRLNQQEDDDMAGEGAEIKAMLWAGGGVAGTVAEGTVVDDVREIQRMLWVGGSVEGSVAKGSLIDDVRTLKADIAVIKALLAER